MTIMYTIISNLRHYSNDGATVYQLYFTHTYHMQCDSSCLLPASYFLIGYQHFSRYFTNGRQWLTAFKYDDNAEPPSFMPLSFMPSRSIVAYL